MASLTKEVKDSMNGGEKRKEAVWHCQEVELSGATQGQFVENLQVMHSLLRNCNSRVACSKLVS